MLFKKSWLDSSMLALMALIASFGATLQSFLDIDSCRAFLQCNGVVLPWVPSLPTVNNRVWQCYYMYVEWYYRLQ
jgi:hypothetical protein